MQLVLQKHLPAELDSLALALGEKKLVPLSPGAPSTGMSAENALDCYRSVPFFAAPEGTAAAGHASPKSLAETVESWWKASFAGEQCGRWLIDDGITLAPESGSDSEIPSFIALTIKKCMKGTNTCLCTVFSSPGQSEALGVWVTGYGGRRTCAGGKLS